MRSFEHTHSEPTFRCYTVPPFPQFHNARCRVTSQKLLGIVLTYLRWVFVLDQWVFVIDHRVFVIDHRVFVIDHRVFILDQWVFVLGHRGLGLRFWVFVLETPAVSVAISLSNNLINSNLARLKYVPQVFTTSFSAFFAESVRITFV